MIRRLLDITFSALALVLTSPLLLAVMIAIRLESKGDPIYRQRRIGLQRIVLVDRLDQLLQDEVDVGDSLAVDREEQ